MIFQNKNFSRDKISNVSPEDGDEFDNCNLSQVEKKKIFENVNSLQFKSCNLVNCEIPANASKDDCLHVYISYCTNLHPGMIDSGLGACEPECLHMVGEPTEIYVDSVLVDTVYPEEIYKNTVTPVS